MISIEVFAAKDEEGRLGALMIAVPVRCGLSGADTLHVKGRRLKAKRGNVVMAVDLPELDDASLQVITEASKKHRTIAVAEFNALGVVNSYMLQLVVAS